MAYCTLADQQALMDQTFTASTEPTATQVEQMIDDVASEMDGVFRAAGYSTPITASDAAGLLRKMNSFGTGPTAFHASYLAETEPPRVRYWRETYNDFLARVRRGEQQLPGVTPEGDIDPVMAIAPGIQREEYWLTDQDLT